MPNFVSFSASTAELAHGEKSHTQSLTHSITHPAYLMRREPGLAADPKRTVCFSDTIYGWPAKMGGRLRFGWPAKMGLVPFRQPSTLFCCCHLVLHIFCCIVENKPSLSLTALVLYCTVNVSQDVNYFEVHKSIKRYSEIVIATTVL